MKFNNSLIILTILGLSISLPACGKDKEKKFEAKTEAAAPDRGLVNLGGQAPPKGQEATPKSGPYRGLDPAKVAKLSPEARKMLEESNALTKKRLENSGMSGADYMKAAGGGREVQPPKF